MIKGATRVVGVAMLWATGTVSAQILDFQIGEFRATAKNAISIGGAVRMQDPSNDLLGKLNVPGQQDLCAPDNCLSLSGDPAPNQRLIDAPGAFSGVNADDGNMNYRKHDLVAATSKFSMDWSFSYGDFVGRLRGLYFFDPVNVDFEERKNDTRFQPARVARTREIERRFANGFQLFEAFVSREFSVFDRFATITVGNQYLRWGESTLVAVNSINEISPPSQAFLRFPGVEFNEIFLPVPLVTVSAEAIPGVTAEVFYQLQWKRAEPDPSGSFFSDIDLIGKDRAAISLGQFGEDPDRQFRFAPPIGTVSSSSTTAILGPEAKPRDSRQFGMKLSYFADWLNGGTELNAYAMNYHSRLPLVRVTAAQASCLRVENNGRGDSSNLLEAVSDCQLFNGDLIPGRAPSPDREPLPVETFSAQLAYPEDIRLFGVSFNTTVGKWSLAGEYVYRPNLPLQVHLTDAIFMGLSPAFPPNRIPAIGPLQDLLLAIAPLAPDLGLVDLGALAQLGAATFPSDQDAIPSFLQRFRGVQRVAPGQVIDAWERMKVHQFDFTGIRAIADNPFGADLILLIAEVGGTYIQGMPSRDQLQFETGVLYRTHASPGADCSGSPEDPVSECTLRLNPTQQTNGFATSFSWGLRSIIRGEYNNGFFGLNYRPQIIAAWDVSGFAPFPSQNFVEGRKDIDLSTDIIFTQSLTLRVGYQWIFGGGLNNSRRDRDNASFNLTYNF